MKTYRQRLLEQADIAIAWGTPDNESIGCSHSQLINLIWKLKNELLRYPEKPVTDDL